MIIQSSEIYSLLISFIEPIDYLFSTNKRIYWLYLVTSILLSVCVVKRNKLPRFFSNIASRRYWFNASTKVDYQWIFTNQILAVLFLLPLLGGQLTWAISVYRWLTGSFGAGDFYQWPALVVMILFSIAIFITEDFSRFFVHYCYHKVPWLWRFHAIHHSAKVMTPFTLYRIHFVEYVINTLRSLSVTGTVSGIFMYLFVGKIGIYEVLGVSLFSLLFNLAGANLRHSHVWLGFGRFENWFISPAQHQIHHSSAKRHLDKNFGSTLSLWDRLFKSWVASKEERVIRFGLYNQKNKQSIWRQLLGIPIK